MTAKGGATEALEFAIATFVSYPTRELLKYYLVLMENFQCDYSCLKETDEMEKCFRQVKQAWAHVRQKVLKSTFISPENFHNRPNLEPKSVLCVKIFNSAWMTVQRCLVIGIVDHGFWGSVGRSEDGVNRRRWCYIHENVRKFCTVIPLYDEVVYVKIKKTSVLISTTML